MDCPICFETITTETGQVTTSCGHSFHFKCLNTWYWQQSRQEDTKESCPCCRKEPCDFERASTVEDSEEDYESTEYEPDEEMENDNTGWVQVSPRRWILLRPGEDRLRVLAEVAEEERKRNQFAIPPYDGESHALWLLRNFFEEPVSPAVQQEETIQAHDRPRFYRRRRRSFGRTFWCHLGKEYDLNGIDGYFTD